MRVEITGAGVWFRAAPNWTEFKAALVTGFSPADDAPTMPGAKMIPPRERRRASLPIKLGVEVAEQACEAAEVGADQVTSVFTSAMADTDVTDYMCRALAEPNIMLSPTRFHNSVHNAPAGYWSISAQNRKPSSYVGGGEHSFAAALIEAVTVAVTEATPVLLVALDLATVAPFSDIRAIHASFAVGLVLSPEPRLPSLATLTMDLVNEPTTESLPEAPLLAALAQDNPSARSLCLLEKLASESSAELQLSLGGAQSLTMQLRSSRDAQAARDGIGRRADCG